MVFRRYIQPQPPRLSSLRKAIAKYKSAMLYSLNTLKTSLLPVTMPVDEVIIMCNDRYGGTYRRYNVHNGREEDRCNGWPRDKAGTVQVLDCMLEVCINGPGEWTVLEKQSTLCTRPECDAVEGSSMDGFQWGGIVAKGGEASNVASVNAEVYRRSQQRSGRNIVPIPLQESSRRRRGEFETEQVRSAAGEGTCR